MARVLPFSVVPPPRLAPASATRAVLGRLIDDLQVIASERPLAIEAIAEMARRFAVPVRRHLRQQAKAALRPRRAQKRSG